MALWPNGISLSHRMDCWQDPGKGKNTHTKKKNWDWHFLYVKMPWDFFWFSRLVFHIIKIPEPSSGWLSESTSCRMSGSFFWFCQLTDPGFLDLFFWWFLYGLGYHGMKITMKSTIWVRIYLVNLFPSASVANPSAPSSRLTLLTGKWTCRRCSPYWRWGCSIAMLVYQSVVDDLTFNHHSIPLFRPDITWIIPGLVSG